MINKARVFELVKPIIKDAEGLSLKPYLCPAGYPTVGWGHKLSDKASDLHLFPTITLEEAERLLGLDVDIAYRQVLRYTQKPLVEGQVAALVDFVFNLGIGQFKASTLLKKINAGEFEEVPTQLRRWVHSGGKRLAGLVKRREKDIQLWNTK